jgi:N-acetylglucosamine malate deacetylase 1
MSNILVIAAHPDDEVIGMGGTIKKITKNNKVILCVVSEGASAQYKDKKVIEIRRDACKKASNILGVSKIEFLDFPDMMLDTIPHLEINRSLEKIIKKYQPKIVYTTPPNDLNLDHLKVHESSLVVTRHTSSKVKQILCYEISSITKNQFQPTIYENINLTFSYKIKAMKSYKTEIRKFPHPRSFESIKNLSIHRGIESGLKKAEAFSLIKKISD